MQVYADYNATAPLRPQARDAMIEAFETTANPSSVHGPGRSARRLVECARGDIAGAIGARAEDLTFTSGGTEANALGLMGLVAALDRAVTLIVSPLEHDAVRGNAAMTRAPVETAPVTPGGQIDLDWLEARLADWDTSRDGTPVLALMLANNETGIIQPVREAAELVHQAGGLVHCDGVQGLGKLGLDVGELDVDLLALSAHKAGGAQGVGALWHRPGLALKPVLLGGGQERSLRSGTENVAGIAGFGAAARACVDDLETYHALAPMRDAMETRLEREGGIQVIGKNAPRLAATSCFAAPGFRAETQVMALDLAGVAVSSGAACSSGKVSRSPVLDAMGVGETLADCAIRTSFGWRSTESDFEMLGDAWLAAARRTILKETA